MCFFKVATPSVQNMPITASQLLPQTEAKAPESPAYGGSDDVYKHKGRDSLKINLNKGTGGYNPVNM